jgi:predicted TIM-barrel fold metal-dependent hydrolase
VITTDVRPFDADNHYYEPLDAFTRHLDPKLRGRTVDVAEIHGRVRYIVGGRVDYSVTNPMFDPIVKPGCLYGYFRANPEGKALEEYMRERESIPSHYRERDARLAVMDEQGLSSIWLFPTLGVLYEHALRNDPDAVAITFRAFNRWLEEDWGLNWQNRIYAAPYISLADVDFAVSELDWALDHGARVVCMRPAAPTTKLGSLSPGHPTFDPFWARVNEAGITVAVHGANSGYGLNGYGDDEQVGALASTPLRIIMTSERPIMDFFSSILCDRLFDRFPNLRLASIENGAGYLPSMMKKLRKAHHQWPGFFREDPVETFRRHVWINPFWEDDVHEVIELMSPDRVIFGSDWPHAEGLVSPLDYIAELKSFDTGVQDKIMRDNAVTLTALEPG